jgi:hypothetical protein
MVHRLIHPTNSFIQPNSLCYQARSLYSQGKTLGVINILDCSSFHYICLDIIPFSFASPWWLKLYPSKWSSLGMGLLLGTPLKSHRTIPNHTYHFPSLFPSISLSLGILGCIDPRRGCPSFYGKKGMKVQRD